MTPEGEREGTLSIKVQVDGFVAQVEHLVEQCALARAHRESADLFLWSAHRCLEAMLRALLVPYPPRRFSALTVEELLKDATDRTIIPPDHAGDFERVWRLSRIGTRVRDHLPPDLTEYVPECAERLVAALRWFYEKSPARREIGESLRAGLEALASDEPLTSREEVARARQAMLLAQIESMAADHKARLEAIGQAADVLVGRIEEERAAVEETGGVIEELHERLEGIEGFPRRPEPAGPSAEGGIDGLRRFGWLIGLVVGLACGATIALGAVGFGAGAPEGSSAGGEGVEEGAAETDASADAALPATRAAPDGGAARVARSDAAAKTPPSRCPADTVEYEPAVVRVLQPFPRATWPPGPKALPAVPVGRFCLDRDPVLVSDYEKCSAAGACRPRIRCLDHPRNFPVNCVTWEQADQYCRWRGGRLPSVVQWERTLLPGSEVRVEPSPGTWEWVADAFPSPVFQRGPAKKNADGSIWGYMALQKQFVPAEGGRRICSWHKAPATASRGNLSFRCAIDLAGDRDE